MNTKKQNLQSLKDIHQRFSEKVGLNRLTGSETLDQVNAATAQVSSLVTDSRRVTPGSAFFAIRGFRTNGEEFIDEAIKNLFYKLPVLHRANQGNKINLVAESMLFQFF